MLCSQLSDPSGEICRAIMLLGQAKGRGSAQHHLELCSWCAKRYHFEERLRHYVRVAINEPMSAELKAKLSALRTPLDA